MPGKQCMLQPRHESFSSWGANIHFGDCQQGMWKDYSYCVGDEYPCEANTDTGLVQLARGWLNEARNQSSNTGVAPNSTAVVETSSPVTGTPAAIDPACPTAPKSSNSRAQAGIGAGVGVPLALALGGAMVWALRERNLRRRAEAGHSSYYPPDVGGIANMEK
ncbi:MAG: hypothetical protein Q9186_006894 [Xanthomendoza sp. 1 TL-2023]